MFKEALRPAWVEINVSNLDYNIKQIRSKFNSSMKITAVIKADAYGHGAVKVASVLRANNISSFGVATVSEAMKLRVSGFSIEEIIVMSSTPEPYLDSIVEYRLSPVVCDYQTAREISRLAARAGITIRGYIAVDTGMGRIGYNCSDAAAIEDIKLISQLSNFKIAGLFSHFATSDEEDKTFAIAQDQLFNIFYKRLYNEGVKIPYRSIANSAAIMEMPYSGHEMVRPGIVLYGCYPSDQVDKSTLSIRPVMSVKANVMQVKRISPGTSISYGRHYVATRESTIATLSLGYADGLPRVYSDNGRVIINGVMAPIAGRVCMDQVMVDVTQVPYVRPGDEAVIMGQQGINEISADDIAAATGTISYEILCGFGQRLPKVYVY